jgi:ABC-type methionine transport system ATPase subunit
MSTALAAARKRRAPASLAPEPPVQQSAQNAQAPPTAGLTLPQVIAVIDKRLITLEEFVKSQQQNEVTADIHETTTTSPAITEIIEEFNSRYTILAEEIDNLKNIVLNLQSYTMNVNKTLLEERIQVLSEADVVPKKNITISSTSDAPLDYLEQIGGEFTLESSNI